MKNALSLANGGLLVLSLVAVFAPLPPLYMDIFFGLLYVAAVALYAFGVAAYRSERHDAAFPKTVFFFSLFSLGVCLASLRGLPLFVTRCADFVMRGLGILGGLVPFAAGIVLLIVLVKRNVKLCSHAGKETQADSADNADMQNDYLLSSLDGAARFLGGTPAFTLITSAIVLAVQVIKNAQSGADMTLTGALAQTEILLCNAIFLTIPAGIVSFSCIHVHKKYMRKCIQEILDDPNFPK